MLATSKLGACCINFFYFHLLFHKKSANVLLLNLLLLVENRSRSPVPRKLSHQKEQDHELSFHCMCCSILSLICNMCFHEIESPMSQFLKFILNLLQYHAFMNSPYGGFGPQVTPLFVYKSRTHILNIPQTNPSLIIWKAHFFQ